ncbi:tubulin binding cofactor A [Artomyces pyxidatus]|uniref:Tubulin binding cofactor A n=1 Tax=Artomyces pyxidatus TaxID=48021 RepID=A0ACB8TI37_9AGAM|nr:tubulin binding cofactor A [Artomyces pyxidatus]
MKGAQPRAIDPAERQNIASQMSGNVNAEAIRAQLEVTSGIARLLLAEHLLYRQEAEDNRRRRDKFRALGADEWVVNDSARVLRESQKRISDVDRRLGKAVVELRDLVVHAKMNPELQEDEGLMKAEEALEEVSV